jgi:hypothetical protein
MASGALGHMHPRAAVVAIAGILLVTWAQESLTTGGRDSRPGHAGAALATWTYDAEPDQQCVVPGRRPPCLRNAGPTSLRPSAEIAASD